MGFGLTREGFPREGTRLLPGKREARATSWVAGGNQEGREGVWPGVESELAEREVVDQGRVWSLS